MLLEVDMYRYASSIWLSSAERLNAQNHLIGLYKATGVSVHSR